MPIEFEHSWAGHILVVSWKWTNSIAHLNSMLYYFLELFPEQLSGYRVKKYVYEGTDYSNLNVGQWETEREFDLEGGGIRGFYLFKLEETPKLLAKNRTLKFPSTRLTTMLRKMWAELSDTEKDSYEMRA